MYLGYTLFDIYFFSPFLTGKTYEQTLYVLFFTPYTHTLISVVLLPPLLLYDAELSCLALADVTISSEPSPLYFTENEVSFFVKIRHREPGLSFESFHYALPSFPLRQCA